MVKDPVRLRLDIFGRRRLLHAQRYWLRARTRARGAVNPPRRPVFVIGCPRSGTTLLFRLLRQHEAFWAPRGEGHILWNTFQHPKRKGWSSDRVTPEDIDPAEPRFLYGAMHEMSGEARFLDKTPRNSLKVPYLAELFSDATFVLLKRNGPDTVSSLIEGWKVRHGVSYRLPHPLDLAEYKGRLWSYVLPPGWRDRANTSIAEVAALQYTASYDTALADLSALAPASVVELKFEDLLREPVPTVTALLDRLELPGSERLLDMALNLGAHPVQVTSAPRPEKWRDRAGEIMRVLPQIAPTMTRLGYDTSIDP